MVNGEDGSDDESDDLSVRGDHVSHRQDRRVSRRSNDKMIDLLLKYWPLLAALAAILGTRVVGPSTDLATINARVDGIQRDEVMYRLGIDKKFEVDFSRDSLSIAERAETRQATEASVTSLGRVVCSETGMQLRAIQSGVPCPMLEQGQQWPLFHRYAGLASERHVLSYPLVISSLFP